MCIMKVTAFTYEGKHYDTEQSAVRAAINEIGRKIVKDHSGNPGRGLVENPDLPGLLSRYSELTTATGETDRPDPHKSPEGTHAEPAEGTRAYEAGKLARQQGKTKHSTHGFSGEQAHRWRWGWGDENADIDSYSGPSIYLSPDPLNDDGVQELAPPAEPAEGTNVDAGRIEDAMKIMRSEKHREAGDEADD